MSEEISPRRLYHYSVDTSHTLEVKEYGIEDGIPCVFLHGGPGSSCRNSLCDLFDLKSFRVIAPDQRGAGNSSPKGSLENNTTHHLIADLEFIRQQLGIEKWVVVGGSWGALLAIAYAETHPQAVSGIVVRALFLGTDLELERAFISLPQVLYPDIYQQFIDLLPVQERNAPLQAYYNRILHPDPDISLPASYVWHDYERMLSELQPSPLSLPKKLELSSYPARPSPSTPRIEAHYFINHCFLEPNQLLENSKQLENIPCIIVQSRYDLLCPPLMSQALSDQWPTSKIIIVEAAGHSVTENKVVQTMNQSIDEIKEKL